MSDKTIHIIGAGVSGLSAAMEIIDNCDDYKVAIYESTSKAGGRCFSFYDDDFKCMLDNGTHMILGANKNTLKKN
jgi:protoporphyrinogen oxidase